MLGPSPGLIHSANAMRGQRYPNVTVVSGPPLAGKTTHVQQHKTEGDLVIDWDALAVALGSPVTHDHDRRLWPFIASARDAVLDRLRRGHDGHAWIITTDTNAASLWPGCAHVRLTVDEDEAERRRLARHAQ